MDIIFDATNITRKIRARFFEKMKKLSAIHYEIEAFYFTTDYKECMNRVKLRNTNKKERYLPLFVIAKYLMDYEIPSLEEGFTKVTLVQE